MTQLLKLAGIQLSLLALLAAPAFAAPEQTIGSLWQELGARNPASVQVKGRLICDLGAENNGQPCSLKIEEEGTSRVFRLRNGSSAMRLFFDGARRATIEGQPDRDPTTLIVESAPRL